MKEITSEDLTRRYPYGTKVKKCCGVYAIVNQTNGKAYIGASHDIYKRNRSHNGHLSSGNHSNSSLQEDYNKGHSFKHYIVCECPEGEELQREKEVLGSYNMNELYNTSRPPQLDKLLPFLEKSTKTKAYGRYIVNKGTGCWESQACHSGSGYSKMIIRIDGKVRHLLKHRVAYWQAHGEYPELIRHKCNNKSCMNPSHLEKGTHADNSRDHHREFHEEFRNVWIELGGDPVKITEHFGWKKNCITSRGGVASSVYHYEKKTGIREEFPEIIKKRKRAVSGNKSGRYYAT